MLQKQHTQIQPRGEPREVTLRTGAAAARRQIKAHYREIIRNGTDGCRRVSPGERYLSAGAAARNIGRSRGRAREGVSKGDGSRR
ncbi:hypothetical protein EVAR_39516_1 [Eumeta japonica]|uniref:Uncharacterized protein n=1 Tax=Eumeta variegata TaxID=151549 RepID=A0A4C1W360_EUMVA|nr:hypothetical protein EVAR_39516_1 [Eumeta japonica]